MAQDAQQVTRLLLKAARQLVADAYGSLRIAQMKLLEPLWRDEIRWWYCTEKNPEDVLKGPLTFWSQSPHINWEGNWAQLRSRGERHVRRPGPAGKMATSPAGIGGPPHFRVMLALEDINTALPLTGVGILAPNEPTTDSKEWCLWRVEKAVDNGDPLPRTKEALAIWVEPLLTEAASRPGSFLTPAKAITIQTGYFRQLPWPPMHGNQRQ